jgi:hypothetical protein
LIRGLWIMNWKGWRRKRWWPDLMNRTEQ